MISSFYHKVYVCKELLFACIALTGTQSTELNGIFTKNIAEQRKQNKTFILVTLVVTAGEATWRVGGTACQLIH